MNILQGAFRVCICVCVFAFSFASQGFKLVDQETLRDMMAGKRSEIHNNKKNPNASYVSTTLEKDLSIRLYPAYKTFVACTGAKKTKFKVYVFGKDLPQSAIGNAKKSFADKAILLKFIALGKQIHKANEKFPVGVYFEELPDYRNEVIKKYPQRIYILDKDKDDLSKFYSEDEHLSDDLAQRINLINTLAAFYPNFHVGIAGHGDVGNSFITDAQGHKHDLFWYPELFKLLLSAGNLKKIDSIHIVLDACYGGSCPIDGGKSMLEKVMGYFSSSIDHVGQLSGYASQFEGNISAGDDKIYTLIEDKEGNFKFGWVSAADILGAFVIAKRLPSGEIVQEIAGLPQTKDDPLILEAMKFRAFLLSKNSNSSQQATRKQIKKPPYKDPVIRDMAIILDLENDMYQYLKSEDAKSKERARAELEADVSELRKHFLQPTAPYSPAGELKLDARDDGPFSEVGFGALLESASKAHIDELIVYKK